MEYDLDYFTEFLDNPSALEINEFFRMLQGWCRYLQAHKDEFNYLEDDDWKEIRERLLDEMDIRMDIKDELIDEFAEMNRRCEQITDGKSPEDFKLIKNRLQFMKTYNYVLHIDDETIAEYEELLNVYSEGLNAAFAADLELRGIEYEMEEAIVRLDKILADIYERTGKPYAVPRYTFKKVHKGN